MPYEGTYAYAYHGGSCVRTGVGGLGTEAKKVQAGTWDNSRLKETIGSQLEKPIGGRLGLPLLGRQNLSSCGADTYSTIHIPVYCTTKDTAPRLAMLQYSRVSLQGAVRG